MANIVTRLLLNTSGFDGKLQKSGKQVSTFGKMCGGLKGTLGSLGGTLAAGAGFASFAAVVTNAVKTTAEFEEKVSQLSSLTGMVGADLDYLKEAAISLGGATTMSAGQVADAFKLIGSKMPQLLQAKEALVAVTTSAITLSEAASIDLADASVALTGALNQMGQGAEFAGQYINVLAAASQKGTADIPYLNTAIEKCGATAANSGVSFTELVATIESIAAKMPQAENAGTGLRNIFIKLSQQSDSQLKPSVVGLTTALENLAAKHLDAGQMAEMFGRQNATAALALVSEVEANKKLQDAITNTNTAQEQAATNTDNVKGAVARLSSSWEAFTLHVNQSSGALRDLLDWLGKAITATDRLFMSEQKRIATSTQAKGNERISKSFDNIAKAQDKGMSRNAAIDAEMKALRAEGRALREKYKEAEKNAGRDQRNAMLKNAVSPVSLIGSAFSPSVAAINIARHAAAPTKVENTASDYKAVVEALKALKAQKTVEAKPAPTPAPEPTATPKVGGGSTRRVTAPVEAVYDPDSLKGMEQQISKLRGKMAVEIDRDSLVALQQQIDALETDKRALKFTIETEAKQKDENGYWKLAPMAKEAEMSARNIQQAFDSIDVSKFMLSATGIEAYEKKMAAITAQKDKMDGVADAIGGIGSALSATNNDLLSWVGAMAQATAQVVQQLAGVITATQASKAASEQNTAAKMTEGIAAGTASAAQTPVVGWILAAAAMASMIALFASMPKFATGGIVAGQDWTGDHVPLMANSGELILNKAQQTNIARQLQNDRAEESAGRVTITGEQLYVTMRNYMKRSGKNGIKLT